MPARLPWPRRQTVGQPPRPPVRTRVHAQVWGRSNASNSEGLEAGDGLDRVDQHAKHVAVARLRLVGIDASEQGSAHTVSAFTRMPTGPSSLARVRVRPCMAALAAP